jgi:hypothetical protein
LEKLNDCRGQANLNLMAPAGFRVQPLAAPKAAPQKIRRKTGRTSAGLPRGERCVDSNHCVGAAGNFNPVNNVFLPLEPAQFNQMQSPAVPIQRGQPPEIDSKEAQIFSLVGLRQHVQ